MADSQSRSFWSFLILVDVLLLIAFGWALASRASHLLEEPAVGSTSYVKLPKAKPALPSPPAVAAPEPEPPAPQAPPPAPEPGKTLVKAPEAPKPVPEPAKARPPEPARAKAEPAPVKAKRVVFTYKNKKAGKVSIEGSFTKWSPKPMHRHNGEWRYAVYLLPGAEYPYRFVVDGKPITDPANTRQKWGKSLRPVD